jgi:uncharacterized protein (TIGR02118 family)
MIKVVSMLWRNPALSPAEFRDYWENTHVPLVRSLLPGLVHYTGSFPISDGGPPRPGTAIECDAIVELGWPDTEMMARDMASPEFNTSEREASSARLMDLPRTRTMLVEEVRVAL